MSILPGLPIFFAIIFAIKIKDYFKNDTDPKCKNGKKVRILKF